LLDHAEAKPRLAAFPAGVSPRDGNHARGGVDADGAARRPHRRSRQAREHARAAADVEHALARLERGVM
jgi:hypothetical protein